MDNCCPICKMGFTDIHRIINTLIGYCQQCKKEFYLKPDGAWVDRKTYKELCDDYY